MVQIAAVPGLRGLHLDVTSQRGDVLRVIRLASLPDISVMNSVPVEQVAGDVVAKVVMDVWTPTLPPNAGVVTAPYYLDGVQMGFMAMTAGSGSFLVHLGYMYRYLLTEKEYDMLAVNRNQVLTFAIPANSYIVDGVLIDTPTEFSITFTPPSPSPPPYLVPAIVRASLDIYNGGTLFKSLELVRDPYYAVFNPIEVSDLVDADLCTLVISIPYDVETPESFYPLMYRVNGADIGYLNVYTSRNGDFRISLLSLYRTALEKGHDMLAFPSQTVTFTLPSYTLSIEGRPVATTPVDIRLRLVNTLLAATQLTATHVNHIQGLNEVAIEVREAGVVISRQVVTSPPYYQMTYVYVSQIAPSAAPSSVNMFVHLKTDATVAAPGAVPVAYRLDGTQFGTASVVSDSEGVWVEFGDLYGKVLAHPTLGYDMFTKRVQYLSFEIPPNRVFVDGGPLTAISFGFFLVSGVPPSREYHTALPGVTSLQLEVSNSGQPFRTLTVASAPLFEMAEIYLDQIVPARNSELALNILTDANVDVTNGQAELPVSVDGTQFGTSSLTATAQGLKIDLGGLYKTVLDDPSAGYDMFTRAGQVLAITIPPGSVTADGEVVNNEVALSIYLISPI
eukprot:jgi/Mesvir1/11863/Mv00212-RA.1